MLAFNVPPPGKPLNGDLNYCNSCSNYILEPRTYASSRRCVHNCASAGTPFSEQCWRYEREPGADDE